MRRHAAGRFDGILSLQRGPILDRTYMYIYKGPGFGECGVVVDINRAAAFDSWFRVNYNMRDSTTFRAVRFFQVVGDAATAFVEGMIYVVSRRYV